MMHGLPDELRRSLSAALRTGRVGRLVSIRRHGLTSSDDLLNCAAVLITDCGSFFASLLESVMAQSHGDRSSMSVQCRMACGELVLLTLSRVPQADEHLECFFLGSHGLIELTHPANSGSPFLWQHGESPTNRQQNKTAAAIDASLRTNQCISITN